MSANNPRNHGRCETPDFMAFTHTKIHLADEDWRSSERLRNEATRVCHTADETTQRNKSTTESLLKDRIGEQEAARSLLYTTRARMDPKFEMLEQSKRLATKLLRSTERPLQKCKTRMNYRSTRPTEENVVDSVTDAIVEEQRLLEETRRVCENILQSIANQMQNMRNQHYALSADYRDKARAFTLDEIALAHRAPIQKGSLSARNYKVEDAPLIPMEWSQSYRNNAKTGDRIMDETVELCQRSNAECRHWEATISNAARVSADALRKKIATNEDLAMDLRKGIGSTIREIAQCENQIRQVKQCRAAKNSPTRVMMNRTETRYMRPARESVHDPQERSLQNEQACLADTQEELEATINALEHQRSVLVVTRKKLEMSLMHKMNHVSVDRDCLTICF